MKSKPHPDKSQEARQIREELRGETDAIHALNTMAKEEADAPPLPPVPEDLREQWKDRYGEAAERDIQEQPKRQSSFSFWGLGSLAALTAVAMFLVIRSGGPTPLTGTENDLDPTIMRDHASFTPTAETPIIFLASDHVSYQAILPTRKTGRIFEVQTEEEARDILMKHRLESAVLINARTGMLYPIPRRPGDEVQLIENPAMADEYDFSEALDAFLNK